MGMRLCVCVHCCTPAHPPTHPPVLSVQVGVWNPSFDVAPGRLIAAIITERGVIPKQGDTHMVGGGGGGRVRCEGMDVAHGFWGGEGCSRGGKEWCHVLKKGGGAEGTCGPITTCILTQVHTQTCALPCTHL